MRFLIPLLAVGGLIAFFFPAKRISGTQVASGAPEGSSIESVSFQGQNVTVIARPTVTLKLKLSDFVSKAITTANYPGAPSRAIGF